MAESFNESQIEHAAIEMIPESVARRYSVVPLSLRGGVLRVGTENDCSPDAAAEIVNDLGFFLSLRIELLQFGTREDVLEAIERCYPPEFNDFVLGDEYDLSARERIAA